LVKGDYSQMEIRILAQVSKDEYLLNFFSEGKDIHTLIASHMLGTLHTYKYIYINISSVSIKGKDPDQVSSIEREQAKRVVI